MRSLHRNYMYIYSGDRLEVWLVKGLNNTSDSNEFT